MLFRRTTREWSWEKKKKINRRRFIIIPRGIIFTYKLDCVQICFLFGIPPTCLDFFHFALLFYFYFQGGEEESSRNCWIESKIYLTRWFWSSRFQILFRFDFHWKPKQTGKNSNSRTETTISLCIGMQRTRKFRLRPLLLCEKEMWITHTLMIDCNYVWFHLNCASLNRIWIPRLCLFLLVHH